MYIITIVTKHIAFKQVTITISHYKNDINKTNTLLVAVTNEITNTTTNMATTDDISRLTHDYRMMIVIIVGLAISIVTVFF
jgi:hypothetical protein